MGSFLGSFWGHFGGPNFCKIFWTPNPKNRFCDFRGVPKRCQKWHENDIIFVTFSWHFRDIFVTKMCHVFIFSSSLLFSFIYMSCNDVVTSLHDVLVPWCFLFFVHDTWCRDMWTCVWFLFTSSRCASEFSKTWTNKNLFCLFMSFFLFRFLVWFGDYVLICHPI